MIFVTTNFNINFNVCLLCFSLLLQHQSLHTGALVDHERKDESKNFPGNGTGSVTDIWDAKGHKQHLIYSVETYHIPDSEDMA